MIIRENSRLFRVLMFLVSPTPRLPCLVPFIWLEQARVGDNCTDYVRVTLRLR